jgi:hypothetical protein
LRPLLDDGIDYAGSAAWHIYTAPELAAIQKYPWYMGIPFDRRDGRLGISYMQRGIVVVRSDLLRQTNFPEASSLANRDGAYHLTPEVILGEIARQLGWRQADYSQGINPNRKK